MPVDLDNSSTASGEASVSSSGNQPPPPPQQPPSKSAATAKKKRNLPGMPDPEAEVIALSPKTLLATNRFVCEICNKGFQRDQNLQLHRRGHNLPWKLRQRSSKDVKKRVYVCPEPTCVHHDPSRALGDLTGIKKHFCRKHGEKKWKCDKCSKKYAVQSDWKAHSKICGTREYKCDCGTLFSRRDSFITHRAFCDALAEESARAQPHTPNPNPKPIKESDPKVQVESSPPPAPLPHQWPQILLPDNPPQFIEEAPAPAPAPTPATVTAGFNGSFGSGTSSSSNGSSTSSVFASLFASSTASGNLQAPQSPAFTDLIHAMAHPDHPTDLAPSSIEPISLCLSTNQGSSIFGTAGQERRQYAPPPQPAMSATALLQKAAQMGPQLQMHRCSAGLESYNMQWGQRQMEPENSSVTAGLGLGLPCDGGSGLKELMMGTPSVFAGGSPSGGLSALITSIGGGLDVAAAAAASFGGGEFSGKDMRRS
ncbi:zinc finger protein [Salix suchowensis]|nr:zinc finger protein [Salix suchowensis]